MVTNTVLDPDRPMTILLRYADIELPSQEAETSLARARVLLLLDEGMAVSDIALRVDCVRATVYRTVYRFEELGVVHRFSLPTS